MEKIITYPSRCIYNGTSERNVDISTVKSEFSSVASLHLSNLERYALQGQYGIPSYMPMQGMQLKIT